ncbi:MAG: acylphosphatase [Hyphomicrobiales bacterium]|nr:acylphosphatase [Hyphomicrobiales bacterium]
MTGQSAANRTVHVLVSGHVQGVWYRGWARETAVRLGLDGWVRNRANGTVEAVFSGSPGEIAEMLVLCGEGPPHAQVSDVRIIEEGGSVAPGFTVRYSA